MKHATDDALNALEALLAQIRMLARLKEKKRGVFYRKSKPFLHFHEDPAGLFADLVLDGTWMRLSVTSAGEQAAFMAELLKAVDQE